MIYFINFRFAYVSEAEYARRYSSERKPIREIIQNIKHVLKSHIEQVNWMNVSHRRYAETKLKHMKIIVGAPEEMYQKDMFDELLGLDQVAIIK